MNGRLHTADELTATWGDYWRKIQRNADGTWECGTGEGRLHHDVAYPRCKSFEDALRWLGNYGGTNVVPPRGIVVVPR